ncbi:ran-specific GTPase-activating protein-like [Glandiceps talaboti]
MAENKHEEVPPSSPDVHFEPVVQLAPVETKTMEEDEEVIFNMRAKLFRYANDADPAEWKERGTGDLKILKHKNDSSKLRLLMRRDKTLKVCANHYITKAMDLVPNCGSDRAWVWNVLADFADEEPKPETLAVRFANAENAQKFKAKFEECQKSLSEKGELEANTSKDEDANKVAEKLGGLSVKDEETKTTETDKSEERKEEISQEDKEDDKSEETKAETKDDSKPSEESEEEKKEELAS